MQKRCRHSFVFTLEDGKSAFMVILPPSPETTLPAVRIAIPSSDQLTDRQWKMLDVWRARCLMDWAILYPGETEFETITV